MVCVIHGLFNDLSCPGCRESAFKKAASGIRPDAIEAAALRADERARQGLPEYIEICSRCGLEGRNGERKTMGCPSAEHQHDYRKYVPDVTAELDRAYTTGAALVVERDALKAQVQSLEYELKDKRGQFDDAKTEREIELEKQVERYKCALEKGPGFVEPALYERTRRERNAARVQVAALRGALAEVLNSASPHPAEHPAMTRAWRKALAALADPNLGADWVPRAELEAAQESFGRLGAQVIALKAELARLTQEADAANRVVRDQFVDEKNHQAELRRVSEAVQLRCVAYVVGCGFVDDIELRKIAAGMMATDHVDLGAIVRGGK